MPSPETDDPASLIDARPAAPRRRKRWLWIVLGLLIAVPVIVTLAGALTSPPHVAGPPVGHLIYLDADQPSEHTTNLRGLRIMAPNGSSRLLLHETEDQDQDTGKREWITQPQASPDGKWLAYERQDITILEERRDIINQVWVLPLDQPNPKPRMLLDLSQAKLKQFVGLAWSKDDNYVTLLNDGAAYDVDTVGNPGLFRKQALPNCPPLKSAPTISATQSPVSPLGLVTAYTALTPSGPVLVNGPNHLPGISLFAFSSDGKRVAWLTEKNGRAITIADAYRLQVTQTLRAAWGWSVFGKRKITSLKWSPDGRYIAYTVSKPPLEDELFYVDTVTKKCYQLPVRTGQGGWDWAP